MNGLAAFSLWAQKNRWVWSAIGVLVLWLVLSIVTNRFSLSSLSGIILSASFLTVVGIGQMFVVTTGRGNIDLSVASVITLSAFVALLTIKGQDANLAIGVGAAILLGLAVGCLNSLLVVGLNIPAIIATLATGYVLATATLLSNRAISGFAVSPLLKTLATGRVSGVPIMAVIAIVGVAATAFVLRYTVFGQLLSAVGQNRTAARLAAIRNNRIIASAFIISAVLASLNGLLLGAYIGGAFLEMGQPYLLQSIAAVVLGGTLIFGGSASAVGTLFASILLILIVTTMQIVGLPPGAQDIVQGIVVIFVLALAGRQVLSRRAAVDRAGDDGTLKSE
ncbi:permease component of ribose/xylose/arabinose/galactoside ABC-type transporters [Mesorhizobium australicum WSM2073]|uniref:Autoinducer 2 import system permease protein LsrC n=1 Tax=Mesorhizobium australicum (strain HAMBI 3006 / LMG 24608 / WSM2073) TaxID=754035 RepID=L0KU05_MESAW|nr:MULTISPECIES: ABC transporter permease [Mesorhizobium]AGB47568.1 permease component of ribose/xylose/arabinose/galactoside ABC-type transporters [Mesorhizobium australicum WSM2073]MBZ9906401.1 ABC transporter permease [Mesorhizobium sp. BR115XR7A]MBZ9928512.1 ABC transporter permease [Mesorhizobium sp. BR1-1-5]